MHCLVLSVVCCLVVAVGLLSVAVLKHWYLEYVTCVYFARFSSRKFS